MIYVLDGEECEGSKAPDPARAALYVIPESLMNTQKYPENRLQNMHTRTLNEMLIDGRRK